MKSSLGSHWNAVRSEDLFVWFIALLQLFHKLVSIDIGLLDKVQVVFISVRLEAFKVARIEHLVLGRRL